MQRLEEIKARKRAGGAEDVEANDHGESLQGEGSAPAMHDAATVTAEMLGLVDSDAQGLGMVGTLPKRRRLMDTLAALEGGGSDSDSGDGGEGLLDWRSKSG